MPARQIPETPDKTHGQILLLIALGVVFGDIGTLPLYAARQAPAALESRRPRLRRARYWSSPAGSSSGRCCLRSRHSPAKFVTTPSSLSIGNSDRPFFVKPAEAGRGVFADYVGRITVSILLSVLAE